MIKKHFVVALVSVVVFVGIFTLINQQHIDELVEIKDDIPEYRPHVLPHNIYEHRPTGAINAHLTTGDLHYV